MTEERLFALQPTSSEKRARTIRSRAAQGSMFTFDAEADTLGCPACGASDVDGCTCSRTGAQALTLEV